MAHFVRTAPVFVLSVPVTRLPTCMIPLVSAMKYQAVRKRLRDMYVGYTDVEPGLVEAWVDS